MLRCSRLGRLTTVSIDGAEVDLPALACISTQLRSVTFRNCLLLSSCPPAAGTSAFASGWPNLEELDLPRSSIDTHILAVNLPSLQQLELRGFNIKHDSDDSKALYGSMEAFALGCPRATYVEFEPSQDSLRCPFKNFAALERLQLAFGPVYLGEHYMQWEKRVTVPTSLTALEIVSSTIFDSSMSRHTCISLCAGLAVATACIRAGAPLHSLKLRYCRSAELVFLPDSDDSDDDEDGVLDVVEHEPDEEDLEQQYRPLATALHGLVHLDLTDSWACGEAAVGELVLSAPSLESLRLHISDPGCAHHRVLLCAGLQKLHGNSVWDWDDLKGAPLDFTLILTETAKLRSCMLEISENEDCMRAGDAITVKLHGMACIAMSAEQVVDMGSWLLGFEVHLPGGAEGLVQEQATLSYAWEEEEGWTCDVDLE